MSVSIWELEIWDRATGKGLDDLLVAKGEPTLLTGDAAMAEIQEILGRK
jgi:hypothetical protein